MWGTSMYPRSALKPWGRRFDFGGIGRSGYFSRRTEEYMATDVPRLSMGDSARWSLADGEESSTTSRRSEFYRSSESAAPLDIWTIEFSCVPTPYQPRTNRASLCLLTNRWSSVPVIHFRRSALNIRTGRRCATAGSCGGERPPWPRNIHIAHDHTLHDFIRPL